MSDPDPEDPARDHDSSESAAPSVPRGLRLPIMRGADGHYYRVNEAGEPQPRAERPPPERAHTAIARQWSFFDSIFIPSSASWRTPGGLFPPLPRREPPIHPIADDDPRDGPASELAGAVLRDEMRLLRTVARLLARISGMSAPLRPPAVKNPPTAPVTEGRSMTYKEAAKEIGYPTPRETPNGEALAGAIRRAKPGSALHRLKGRRARTSNRRLRAEIVAEVATIWRAVDKDARDGLAARKSAESKSGINVDPVDGVATIERRINRGRSG